MKIICNECKKNFKLKKLKAENITDEIKRIYFICPKCKHKYIVSYIDKEIEENIKRIKELDREAINTTDDVDIVNLIKKRNNLKQRNLEKSERYMSLFKGV